MAARAWVDAGAIPADAESWRGPLASRYATHAALCAAAAASYACQAWSGKSRDWSERLVLRSNVWMCGAKTAQSAWVAATARSADADSAVVAGWVLDYGAKQEANRFSTACKPAKEQQPSLLRDIAGNPFREAHVIPPDILTWNDGTVSRLAVTIYQNRSFEDLPILAAALENAGCADADLVGHLRHPGPHVLGCWVLDRILAKEIDSASYGMGQF